MEWLVRIERKAISCGTRSTVLDRLKRKSITFTWLVGDPIINKDPAVLEIKNIQRRYAQDGDSYFEIYRPQTLMNTLVLMLDIVQQEVNGKDSFSSILRDSEAKDIYPELLHELIKYSKSYFEEVCVHRNGFGDNKIQLFSKDINYSDTAEELRLWLSDEKNYQFKLLERSIPAHRKLYVERRIVELTEILYKPNQYSVALLKWEKISEITSYTHNFQATGVNEVMVEYVKGGRKLTIAILGSNFRPSPSFVLRDDKHKAYYFPEDYKLYTLDIHCKDHDRVSTFFINVLSQLANDDIEALNFLCPKEKLLEKWKELLVDVINYIFEVKSYNEFWRSKWKESADPYQKAFIQTAISVANEHYNISRKIPG
jgi:hypothetical protein